MIPNLKKSKSFLTVLYKDSVSRYQIHIPKKRASQQERNP